MTTTRLIRGPASRLLLLRLAPSSWHARPGRRARGPAQGGPRPVNLPGGARLTAAQTAVG